MAIKQVANLAALAAHVKPTASRGIQEVVLHHTWSPTAQQYRGKATWDAIRQYHMNERGWSDIGYHFGVGPDGSIWALRDYKRSGAHVLNRNAHTIGVAMVGNFDMENPATNGLILAARVVRVLVDRFSLEAQNIRFHREFANKTCPGTRIDLSKFRSLVFGTAIPSEDTEPNIRTLGVVLGGKFIECEPRLVGGRLTVAAAPFFNALDPQWSIGFEYPDFVHADTGRMYIDEAAPWFRERGWVIGGEVWRQEQAGGVTVKRLYPQRVEWMAP